MTLNEDERNKIKKEWSQFLSSWPFQWVAHLSFSRVPEKQEAEERLKLWTRNICREERLRVGHISIFNELNRGHLHSLLLSKEADDRKTLRDIDRHKWATKWNHEKYLPGLLDDFGGVAEIDEIYDVEGIGDYVASNITIRSPEKSDFWYYDKDLLSSFKSQDRFSNLINEKKADPNAAIKIISEEIKNGKIKI